MNKFWKRLLLLLLISGYLGACQPKRKIINRYPRPLTASQLQNKLQERDAELIFKRQIEDSTFVILETETDIWQGTFSAETFEFDNQTTETIINHSLSSTPKGPDVPVYVKPLKISGKNQGDNVSLVQIAIIIHNKTLLEDYKKVRLTFSDSNTTTIPKSEQKGLLFAYDPLEKGSFTLLELLSEQDKVLYRSGI